MRFTPRRSDESSVSAAVAVALGLCLVGGMSTAAQAAQSPSAHPAVTSQTTTGPTVRAAVSATVARSLVSEASTDTTTAPYISAEAEALANEPLDDIVDDARDALGDAREAVSEAEAAEKKVARSKLKITGAQTIDTSVVEDHIETLQTIAVTPVLLLPASTEEAAADTAKVEKATDRLLSRLEKAEKAEERRKAAAAAKKKAEEAARKAAAQAEAASSSGGSSGSGGGTSSGSPASSGDNSVAGAKATARALLADRGWGSDQFSCLEKLWNKESGWNYRAYNSSSGAYGIPQALPGSKMGSAGSDWKSSAATQIRWGLGYIDGRYGTPCGAWSHSQSTGWY
ncbi:lytic transglycosylase domain-containing protein [Microbacterium sp. TNHR37B]|uniref:aggregation-promoting factor C-terminal-like domain-containing protein n=1 Tax=Microbacterium sp. TNHR37B TaxID=1775956 RepID=UPI0007B21FD3|nr:lytic transglycosylase domain-containing protein [Microbacterium sp. TNHR37B]KZE88686.1 hypothetical protein AVP41_03193 [Microbacterium sp. TNHR37B]